LYRKPPVTRIGGEKEGDIVALPEESNIKWGIGGEKEGET